MKQSVYIFDVDGVLNDMQSYAPDDRVISQIATLMEQGAFVAINTGRGYAWVEENVVQGIRRKLHDDQALARLFVAVEMGGIGVEFTDGIEHKVPSAFSLIPEQIAQVRHIFEQHPDYVQRMQWYPGKESMATVFKGDGIDMDTWKADQKELTAILQDALKGQHVKVANSTDAIDVHAPEAGKWAGAELIHDWLRRVTDIQHDHFICFGDSIVDYEMARYFAGQSHDTIFVFTGPVFEGVTEDTGIQFVKTSQLYRKGTYQYLQEEVTKD